MSRPPCSLCQRPLADAYFETDRGQRFCQHHRGADACKFCGLVTDSPSGMCSSCDSSALTRDVDLVAASHSVIDWAIGLTGSHWIRTIPIRAARRGELSAGTNGQTKFVIFGSDISLEILIQTPMPVGDVRETIAHEVGHVLLTADLTGPHYLGHHQLSPQEEEGFCEVIRMLWISQNAAPDADWRVSRAMSGNDPVYSAGLRQMWPRFLSTDRTLLGFRSSVLPHRLPTLSGNPSPPPMATPEAQHRPILGESQPNQPERSRPSLPTRPGSGQPTTQPNSRRSRTAVPHQHIPRERPRLNLNTN